MFGCEYKFSLRFMHITDFETLSKRSFFMAIIGKLSIW